ncbi:AraC family transcriptional regulator [Devosia sp.]|uniref:AraC family transcriptional regulator n=1 Tax=Devosia sp. TaxID=1871048 RepID=UPI002626B17A|nr:AraC family transcriptional regulator [Devosia sp.]
MAARYARHAGVDVEALRRQAGLPDDLETGPERWISARAQIEFLNLIASGLDDDAFGFHLALEIDLRELGTLYFAMASAHTVDEALARKERYTALVSEGMRVRYRKASRLIVDTFYTGVERHLDRHQMEFWITCTLRELRELTQQQVAPDLVSFVHPRTVVPADMKRYYGRCPRFSAPHDRLELPAACAGLALVTADPFLDALLLDYAEGALEARSGPRGTLRTRVENAITPRLPHGTTSQRNIAGDLGLSSRSLARKLREEGHNYRKILEDLRADLAAEYLRGTGASVAQVAWILGYSDANAFSRAYKARHGRPPSADR